MRPRVGYCTNVHAGRTLAEVMARLDDVAVSVRTRLSADDPLPVGLWLAASVAAELEAPSARSRFARWLEERSLLPYTLNGFPYSHFHADVVKHAVYRPDWRSEARERYTIALATILADLIPAGGRATISTLPIGWREDFVGASDVDDAAKRLARALEALARIEEETGRRIILALEPEPGCLVDTSEGLVAFVEAQLRSHALEPHLSRHLAVCHDVCHAAVMFESQESAIQTYRSAGLSVAKIQLSSAPRVRFTGDARDRERAAALRSFVEARYLHQTSVRVGEEVAFFEDLPLALDARQPEGEWRVHFHLPIYLETIGGVETTRGEIESCLSAMPSIDDVDVEVETYAWEVVPMADRPVLADGIARELEWARDVMNRLASTS